MTWEQFLEMFNEEYAPLMDRARLVQEYISLKKMNDSVSKVTKMFIKRAFFFPEYAAFEQVQM